MALKHHAARTHAFGAMDRGLALIAAILLVTLGATLGLRAVVSLDALAPAVATLLFGLAALLCGVTLLLRHYGLRIGFFDIAGIITFVGVGVSMVIEPDQMIRLMTLSEQPD